MGATPPANLVLPWQALRYSAPVHQPRPVAVHQIRRQHGRAATALLRKNRNTCHAVEICFMSRNSKKHSGSQGVPAFSVVLRIVTYLLQKFAQFLAGVLRASCGCFLFQGLSLAGARVHSMPRTPRKVLDVGMSRVLRFTISVEVAGLFPSQSCDVPREATDCTAPLVMFCLPRSHNPNKTEHSGKHILMKKT